MRRLLVVLAGLILISTNAFAVEELMKNYRGIRGLGMGGVYFTTGLYDEALFANPAMQLEDPTWKISIVNVTAEGNTNLLTNFNDVMKIKSSSGTSVLSTIADKGLVGENEHYRLTVLPGFYSPHFFGTDTSFAFGILVGSQTNIMLRSSAAVEMESVNDVGPAIGVGHKFLDGNLNVGVNMRMIYRLGVDRTLVTQDFLGGAKLSPTSIGTQGIGLDGDIGTVYKLPFDPPFFKKISAALSLNNFAMSGYQDFGTTLVGKISGEPLRNDRTLNTGVRLDMPDAFILNDNLVAIEWQDIGVTHKLASFWKKFHLGGETHLFSKLLAIRGGINEGYLTGGVGIDLPILKIDIATYGEELGSNAGMLEDRRVALRLCLDI